MAVLAAAVKSSVLPGSKPRPPRPAKQMAGGIQRDENSDLLSPPGEVRQGVRPRFRSSKRAVCEGMRPSSFPHSRRDDDSVRAPPAQTIRAPARMALEGEHSQCAAAFAGARAGTVMVTESGCVQAALPSV